MCGIVGYIGKKKALPILIQGLKKLEYRGYDSAGIAYFKDEHIQIEKCVGRVQDLDKIINDKDDAFIGIGHTRWATHGSVNVVNSHPHQVGNITIVHNGILENYQELRDELIGEGYSFQSDTDTEITCGYIDYLYQKNKSYNMVQILSQCMKVFQGSYAMVIMVKGISDQLFVIKKDSPLVIGIGIDEFYIASDILAYADKVQEAVVLEDMQIGVLTKKKLQIFEKEQEVSFHIIPVEKDRFHHDEPLFDHYMLKEIYEQGDVIYRLNQIYLAQLEKLPDLRIYQKIQIIGCGTAYHAGLIGKYLLEQSLPFEVNVFIASEYRYQKIFIGKDTLVIFVSQSGETADTLACIKKVQEYGASTLGIVNVKHSSIARLVDKVIYTEAGPEIAVASTKAYLSQIYIFSLLSFQLEVHSNILSFQEGIDAYSKLPKLIEEMIKCNYDIAIHAIWNRDNIFYLGRNIDYITMLEGSLKLKEISYIHSEAMPAGELKHGTISLIDEMSAVVALITKEELYRKMVSNLKEVKARGGYVLLLVKESLLSKIEQDCYDEVILIKESIHLIQPILNVIPLQLIAYYVAKRRGLDIDKPRNLAKSVTVE